MRSSRRRIRWDVLARAAWLILAASVASCTGVTAFIPPAGPGEAAPDAASAWTEATRACRSAVTYKGQLRVSGRIGGQGLPTTVNIATGVSAQGLRLEGRAAGRSIFRLAGTAQSAKLYIDDGHRYAMATPEELTFALIGVKFGPDRWLALVTGCGLPDGAMTSGARYAGMIAVSTSTGRGFLQMVDGEWRVMNGLFDNLTVQYRKFAGQWPKQWQLVSEAGRDPAIGLNVDVDNTTVGEPLEASVFSLDMPANATQITLDELRESGPLRRKGR